MPLRNWSLIDSTLREGEQFAQANFSLDDKVEIAQALDAFGVEYLELTTPLASPESRRSCEIIAASFARIHYRNLVNLGIAVLEAPELIEALAEGDDVSLDIASGTLEVAGIVHTLPTPPPFVRDVVASGSVLAYVRRHGHFPGQLPEPNSATVPGR